MRRKPRCFISTRFLLFLPSGFWILLGRRMRAVLPRLRHGNRRRQDWLGGMRWGGFEFSRSCICLGLFLGMGWGRQGGETRPFCGFSFLPSSYPSMTDTDFSRLNFSYELLKLVCFSSGVSDVGWVISLNPVMLCRHFLERCRCDGALGEAPFQVLVFHWTVCSCQVGEGLIQWQSRVGAGDHWALHHGHPAEVFSNASGEMQEPSRKAMKKNHVTILQFFLC